jgi:hypothetical protein
MWDYIIINIALSLAVIVFAHFIWEHLKNTYSIKKVKNLAEIQTNKYKAMIDELRDGNRAPDPEPVPEHDSDDSFLSAEEKNWMVRELHAYLETGIAS